MDYINKKIPKIEKMLIKHIDRTEFCDSVFSTSYKMTLLSYTAKFVKSVNHSPHIEDMSRHCL